MGSDVREAESLEHPVILQRQAGFPANPYRVGRH
jgi:hypothetical protein